MKFLSLLIFVFSYCLLSGLDRDLLGEVNYFENFIFSAFFAGLYILAVAIFEKEKQRKP